MGMLLFAPLAFSQQCRQLTVCSEESLNLLKDEKSNFGLPENASPVGRRGPKGEVGEKGMQGKSCALCSFESTLMTRLAGKFV